MKEPTGARLVNLFVDLFGHFVVLSLRPPLLHHFLELYYNLLQYQGAGGQAVLALNLSETRDEAIHHQREGIKAAPVVAGGRSLTGSRPIQRPNLIMALGSLSSKGTRTATPASALSSTLTLQPHKERVALHLLTGNFPGKTFCVLEEKELRMIRHTSN